MIRHISALVALVALSLSAVACVAPSESGTDVEETNQDVVEVAHDVHFETFEGVDGKQYLRLVAGNGENVLHSQAYTSDETCRSGIDAVVEYGPDARNYVTLQGVDGEWYFNLKAPNGEIVATSEAYTTKANAERGLRTVRSLIRVARDEARNNTLRIDLNVAE